MTRLFFFLAVTLLFLGSDAKKKKKKKEEPEVYITGHAKYLETNKDVVFWTRAEDVPVLGLFKDKKSKKLKIFKDVTKRFTTMNSGIKFAWTHDPRTWERFDLQQEITPDCFFVMGNYFEDDSTWRKRGKEKHLYREPEWVPQRLIVYIASLAFPPVAEHRYLFKGGSDAQLRSQFLLHADLPKVTFLHVGKLIEDKWMGPPDWFHNAAVQYRSKIIFVNLDLSGDMKYKFKYTTYSKDSVPDRGWRIIASSSLGDLWGGYEGELNESHVMQWLDTEVMNGWMKERYFNEVEDNSDIHERRKKKKSKKGKKKKKSGAGRLGKKKKKDEL